MTTQSEENGNAAEGNGLPPWTSLADRSLEGDRDGFQKLLEAVEPWLHTLANRYMSSRLRTVMDTGDIVNIASQRIYLALPKARFESEARFRNWMHEIVKNTAFEEDRDHFQTLRRGPAPLRLAPVDPLAASNDGALQNSLAASVTGPVRAAVRGEVHANLRQALDDLPEDARSIVVERFLKGRAASSLAAERGCTERTVNRDLRVAMEHLRRALKARGLGESGIFGTR